MLPRTPCSQSRFSVLTFCPTLLKTARREIAEIQAQFLYLGAFCNLATGRDIPDFRRIAIPCVLIWE